MWSQTSMLPVPSCFPKDFLGCRLTSTHCLRGCSVSRYFVHLWAQLRLQCCLPLCKDRFDFRTGQVSGYGNEAINLNEDRVSLLSDCATLEHGGALCVLEYGKPVLLQTSSIQAFHFCYQALFSYFCLDSPCWEQRNAGQYFPAGWIFMMQIFLIISLSGGFPLKQGCLGGPQMSEYLKFLLSTVMCDLKNQQHTARSWFCSPLRRIGSQQMPWITSPFVFHSSSYQIIQLCHFLYACWWCWKWFSYKMSLSASYLHDTILALPATPSGLLFHLQGLSFHVTSCSFPRHSGIFILFQSCLILL